MTSDEANPQFKQTAPIELEEESHTCRTCGVKLPLTISNCPNDGTYLTGRLGERLSEQYEFLEEIGAGGIGVVYKAKHRLLDYVVAIKMLRANKLEPSILRRFQQEAKAISTLDHPGIVKLRDFGTTELGQPHMVLDYIRGQTLADLIREKGPLPRQLFFEVFIESCDALSHAHEMGIWHRDVKPSNIMLSEKNNQIKILDFGIAKIVDLADQSANLTKTGEVFGSPMYMSPEQAAGKRVDHRSDIYSLGIVMFEALTGSTPFTGINTFEILTNQMNTLPPTIRSKLKDLPPELEAIVNQCLAKEPFERFQSMSDLKHALIDAKSGKKLRKIASSSAKKYDWKSGETWLLITGVVLFISVAGTLGFLVWQLMKPPESIPVRTSAELGGSDIFFGGNSGAAKAFIHKHIQEKVIDFDKDIVAGTSIDDDALQEFDNTDVTEELTMRVSGIKGPGLAHLIHLPLRKLVLSTSTLTNRSLEEISHMKRLEVLDLSGSNVDDEGLKLLAKLKNLKSLYLKDEDHITNLGLANLAPLSNLESLNLSKNPWLDRNGLISLSKLPSLRNLRMHLNKLMDDDFALLKNFPELKMLALRESKIGDKGVEHLLNTKIDQLDLEDTPITDQSLKTLAKLSSLKELALRHCVLSPAAVAAFKKERTDVKVYQNREPPFNSRIENR